MKTLLLWLLSEGFTALTLDTPVLSLLGEPQPPGTWICSVAVQEADEMLIRCEGGVDAALEYAKMWCKYVKELLSWMEKRLSYGESVHRAPWDSAHFSTMFVF